MAQALEAQHGPWLGGSTLQKLLGFANADAMRRAVERRVLGLPIFVLPGRPGFYVLTQDLARWVITARRMAARPELPMHAIRHLRRAGEPHVP